MDYIEQIDLLNIQNQCIFFEYALQQIELNESVNFWDKLKEFGKNVIAFFKWAKDKIKEIVQKIFSTKKVKDKILNDNIQDIKNTNENDIDHDRVNKGFEKANNSENNEQKKTNSSNINRDNNKVNTYKSGSLINISIKVINNDYIKELKDRYNDIFHLYLSTNGVIINTDLSLKDIINGKNPSSFIIGTYDCITDEYDRYKEMLSKTIHKNIFKEEKIKQSKFSKSIIVLIHDQIKIIDDIDNLINGNIKRLYKYINDAEKAVDKIDFNKISDFYKNNIENNNYKYDIERDNDKKALKYINILKDLINRSIKLTKDSLNELNTNLLDISKMRSLYISYTNVIIRAKKRNPGLVEN